MSHNALPMVDNSQYGDYPSSYSSARSPASAGQVRPCDRTFRDIGDTGVEREVRHPHPYRPCCKMARYTRFCTTTSHRKLAGNRHAAETGTWNILY